MIRLTKVLVPTDFSEPSAKALLYGRALARNFGASLHVLHTVEEPLAQGWSTYGFPAVLPELRVQVLADAQRRLERLEDLEVVCALEGGGVGHVPLAHRALHLLDRGVAALLQPLSQAAHQRAEVSRPVLEERRGRHHHVGAGEQVLHDLAL